MSFATTDAVVVASDAVAWIPGGSSIPDTFLKRTSAGTLQVQNYAGSVGTLSAGVQFPDGTAAVPSVAFASDTDQGFYVAGTDIIGVAIAGLAAWTFDAGYSFSCQGLNALTTTSTDGIVLQNTTAATAGTTVQISPRLRLQGTAWNSSSVASETDYWIIENLPATVAGATTSTLKFGASIAGGAVTYPMTLQSGGTLTLVGPLSVTGLGISAFPGSIVLSGVGFEGGSGTFLTDSANGKLIVETAANTAGVGLDVTTDSLMKVRTRAHTGDAGISCSTAVLSGKTTTYNSVATAGWGTPAINGYGRVGPITNATSASIATYTVGAADGSFRVSANCLVTTSTTHSFSLNVAYTDESNSARVLVLPVTQLAGTFVTTGLITNALGVGPYESTTMHIRCKASTTITIQTSTGGTYTTVVYNAEGCIEQIA